METSKQVYTYTKQKKNKKTAHCIILSSFIIYGRFLYL